MDFQKVAKVKLFLIKNMKDTRLSFNLGNNLNTRAAERHPPHARLPLLAQKHQIQNMSSKAVSTDYQTCNT